MKDTRKCRSCNNVKPLYAFSQVWGSAGVYYLRNCKDCLRKKKRKRKPEPKPPEMLTLEDPAAVWLTKPMGLTYWQSMGLWMLGEEG